MSGSARPDGAAPARSDRRRGGFRRRVRIALAVRLGVILIRLLGMTWRVRVNREEFNRIRKERGPLIFAIWHGELLPLLWLLKGEGVSVLISTHSDGEIIARIAEAFGYRTIRGSSSRGGMRALVEMTGALQRGWEIAVTPDGPRGPRHVFAPGAAVLSQRTGAAVLCGRAFASRAWHLGSWDRFVIPKPFATLTGAYAPPEAVGGTTMREAEAAAARFQKQMSSLYPADP